MRPLLFFRFSSRSAEKSPRVLGRGLFRIYSPLSRRSLSVFSWALPERARQHTHTCLVASLRAFFEEERQDEFEGDGRLVAKSKASFSSGPLPPRRRDLLLFARRRRRQETQAAVAVRCSAYKNERVERKYEREKVKQKVRLLREKKNEVRRKNSTSSSFLLPPKKKTASSRASTTTTARPTRCRPLRQSATTPRRDCELLLFCRRFFCLRGREAKGRGQLTPLSFPVSSLSLSLSQMAHRRLGGLCLPPRPRRHRDGLLPSQQKEQSGGSDDDDDLDELPAPVFVRGLRRGRAVLLRVRALRLLLPEARQRRRRAVQDRVQVEGAVREK